MEGRKRLQIVIAPGEDVTDALLPMSRGGRKLSVGIGERILDKNGEDFDVRIESVDSEEQSVFLSRLEGLTNEVLGTSRATPTVTALSVCRDIERAVEANAFDFEQYLSSTREFVSAMKDRGAHVVYFNASTVDPSGSVSNYAGLRSQPRTLIAHQVDLALLELSSLEGISIVDVDRLIAELGALKHVVSFLDYSPEACDVICSEFLRIVDEYGFFDDRPLVVQVGRGHPK